MSSLAQNSAGASRLVWTAGIVIGASLPHWTRLPVWITGLLLVCVAWRFAIRLLRWPAPGPWLLRLLTLAAFAGVWAQFGNVTGLVPGTGLLVVMMALKFLEAGTQRDHMIQTVIAYFLVFASLLDGGSIPGMLYLLAFVWITTLGLVQVGRQGTLLPGRIPARLAGRLLLQSLPFMLVLFVAFPRLSGALWSSPFDDGGAVTGLSGSMSPGDFTDLALNDEIAFRVDFLDRVPEAQELYWRGPVLNDFDGHNWTWRRPGFRADFDVPEFTGRRSEYVITLDVESRGWLFALDMPQAWSTQAARASILMNRDYQLVLRDGPPPNRSVRYTVTSYSDYRTREIMTASDIARYTDTPPDSNPRTRALVSEMQQDSPDPLTLIGRALTYFARGEFYYTLAPPLLGEHSADEFIFDTQQGFCEHYASAFAIMMRMAGVPARVVTGYQGGEYNPFGDYYIVRQSNAHAWTEVWTDATGWIRIDPVATVAPERVLQGSSRLARQPLQTFAQRLGDSTFLRQLALRWDAVNTFWNNAIIGYSPTLQRDLFAKLGFERVDRRLLLILATTGTILLLLAMSLHYSLKLRHLRTTTDPAARSFGRFERLLQRHDVEPRRRGETPMAYATRAASILSVDADAITRIASAYLAARYEPDRDDSALERLQDLVRNFSPRYVRGSR